MLIGITGRKRSGKDTVAAYLRDNYNFVRYQMAGPLKKAVCDLFGWDLDIVEDGPEKEAIDPTYGISPRQVMQFMGYEFGKILGEKFSTYEEETGRHLYVRRMSQFVMSHPSHDIVIPDIRMPYEVEAIHDLGGQVLRVIRDTGDNLDGHATETFVDTMSVDAEIRNTSSIEELYDAVEVFMKVAENSRSTDE